MPRRHSRHSRRARLVAGLVTLLVPAALLVAAGPTAQAVTGSPPVTAPDQADRIFAGGLTFVDVLANDSDPDGDQLAVCRVGKGHPRGVRVDVAGEEGVAVLAGRKAKPGTYTFTYYACDFSYLTAGTLTVTVDKAPRISVKAVAARPGYLRVTNPADFAISMLYGSFEEEQPDGIVNVRAGESELVRVHRTVIDYVISDRKGLGFFTEGQVRGIELPRGDGPQNIEPLNPRGATWPAH